MSAGVRSGTPLPDDNGLNRHLLTFRILGVKDSTYSYFSRLTVDFRVTVRNRQPQNLQVAYQITMPTTMSRVATAEEVLASYQGVPAWYEDFTVMDATKQVSQLSLTQPEGDQLQRFPAEIRLMIFEEVLSVWPQMVYRGAFDFGPLDPNEFDGEIQISWQILATCRLYYEEAHPILYGKNRIAFCTGAKGRPGSFWRFPIRPHFMKYVTDLSIFYRADEPGKPSAKRVSHFIKALARLAINLQQLTILISSDQRYERACPWDIIFCDHPVAKAIVHMIEKKTIKNMKLRLHDGARVFPGFARFLEQTFLKDGKPVDRTLSFTTSCSCAPYMDMPHIFCFFCQWPRNIWELKPIEELVHPVTVEASQKRMMEMQDDLFELGILPPKDDNEDEVEVEDSAVGPYGGGPPMEDTYDEDRLAFTLGVRLPPRQPWPFISEVEAPAVWSFEQTKITDYYSVA
ncbi:hypothetical protein J1614_011658 [Plenodomus biglobosus]|nr:hypothetical protein J1614_011658 [Plenodomus biglobosus]